MKKDVLSVAFFACTIIAVALGRVVTGIIADIIICTIGFSFGCAACSLNDTYDDDDDNDFLK